MAVTIKDVAKLAGVSPSTVSRVCNGNPTISKETRERVQSAIAELGYELPISPDTQPLPTVRTIGIVLPPSDKENEQIISMINTNAKPVDFTNKENIKPIIQAVKDLSN